MVGGLAGKMLFSDKQMIKAYSDQMQLNGYYLV
jgi:hypothetical protein